jgi:glyoxylase-like metal-dependent hydrolase (beta-lactamase superfamily II)
MPATMIVRQIPVGPMENFAYLAACPATKECVLIDAAWEIERLLSEIKKEGWKLVAALATHAHPDHIGGNLFGRQVEGTQRLFELSDVSLAIHQAEVSTLAAFSRLLAERLRVVHDGGEVSFGREKLRLIATPGHTPGGAVWYGEGALFSGDTLFLTNCGRVDLPGGDARAMFHSLTHVIASLPDETVVYPGHAYDRESSMPLGDVKKVNPYLSTRSWESWARLQ